MTEYRIDYYYDSEKYHFTPTSKFKQVIDKIEELFNKIKNRYNVEINRIFENLSFSKEPEPNNPEYEEYYIKTIGKVANITRVKVAKLFKTNKGRNKIDCFIVIFKNDIPLKVYPHIQEGEVISVIDGLEKVISNGFESSIIQKNLKEKTEINKFEETDLQKLLITYPELIEDGLKLAGFEVPVRNGKIDLVFIDNKNNYLICELKLKFTDQVIGQVIRNSQNFKEEHNLNEIRKAIITLDHNDDRINVCRESGIEVFILKLERY
ncbi:MAG: endonuclease NucS domain-containing protein [Candidatus Helarchaeota archaeon]